ncbi:hypothetical protein DFP73DRAFT_531355 [Morchella snyderi]|nr:hypothetical protein DFP73DRAFT_531355 [Morchella snyderi]
MAGIHFRFMDGTRLSHIHRDAFSSGDVVLTIASRLVVDLRWFARGGTEEPPLATLAMESGDFLNENEATVSDDIQDLYNMPQPTFKYRLTDGARAECHRMMEDMINVSQMLGRYIPGSEPKFMDTGITIHIYKSPKGTTSTGFHAKRSVVDKQSRVWEVRGLWLGGNRVIPGYNASNPTLTSMCFAIYAVDNDIAPAAGKV